MRSLIGILFCFFTTVCLAQKKPLDHGVYDGWESIGERKISDNGQWVAFAKTVQEGDNDMVISSTTEDKKFLIPRGYNIQFTADNKYAVMLVKPLYAATREARIKKKKPEDMPKDSLCIVNLTTGGISMKPAVRSYAMPRNATGGIAVHLYSADTTKKAPDVDEGSDLVVGTLGDSAIRIIRNVSEFKWSKNGKILVVEGRQARSVKNSFNSVMVYRAIENKLDTISRGGNDFSNFEVDSNAYQVAYTAERDSSANALRKFYKLWYWRNGMDTAVMLVDKNSPGMKLGWTVSENRELSFSDSGDRLLFGTAPIRPAKDTSVPEIDQVKVDIWNYKDDYLQTQQLFNLNRELKRSFLALYDLNFKKMVQLADENIRDVIPSAGGDGAVFVGMCDTGRRVQTQWTGEAIRDIYAIDPASGRAKLIKKDVKAFPQPSPGGKYIYWYDDVARHYFAWSDSAARNISKKLTYPLYDEEFDMPTEPNAYGVAKWLKNDKGLLVYDRYDIWQLDPDGVKPPVCITAGQGRKSKTRYRYQSLDPEEQFIDPSAVITLRTQREDNKQMGLASVDMYGNAGPVKIMEGPYAVKNISWAKNANVIAYTKESFTEPTDMYVRRDGAEKKLSSTNPQQANYTWGTAELVSWKAYDGKQSQGILFKPEGFDPSRKYPMICYFYERDSDSLYVYRPPAPVRSRIDISFFVSRGYVIFVPDIHYKKGYPGKGAYDYVVSGARAMVKRGGIDSTKMGIQGQSWGGYQVAYLVTRTKLFAAAWAGAPVANMTSAYGGIRWESGVNRQFQYEKTQSRIGATLWEKQQLYIENSPLFYVPRISTPLVIMSNDNDGAVPWYQGIELFTAMRRNGKQVWLLNYNGEEHNLVQRKNKKDLSVREQQYFDWLLKGAKPPLWITDGVPAVDKGRMGL